MKYKRDFVDLKKTVKWKFALAFPLSCVLSFVSVFFLVMWRIGEWVFGLIDSFQDNLALWVRTPREMETFVRQYNNNFPYGKNK